jgi:hypothetical protein
VWTLDYKDANKKPVSLKGSTVLKDKIVLILRTVLNK